MKITGARRLLERLQQRILRLVGHLVGRVDDVDAVPRLERPESDDLEHAFPEHRES